MSLPALTGAATGDIKALMEKEAFQSLLGEIEKTWKGILETHANKDGK